MRTAKLKFEIQKDEKEDIFNDSKYELTPSYYE